MQHISTRIPNRYPFNWQTLVGYPIALLTQCAGTFSGLICFVPIPCLFIGSCCLVSSFVEDVTTELKQHFSDGQFQRCVGEATNAEMMNHFIKLVQFHMDTKQLSGNPDSTHSKCWTSITISLVHFRLSDEINSIYQYTALSMFLWSMLSICSSLLVIQTELVKCKREHIINQINFLLLISQKGEFESGKFVRGNHIIADTFLGIFLCIFRL